MVLGIVDLFASSLNFVPTNKPLKSKNVLQLQMEPMKATLVASSDERGLLPARSYLSPGHLGRLLDVLALSPRSLGSPVAQTTGQRINHWRLH